MNSTPIPFYANTEDDMRCVQACFRMMLKHFLPKKEYAWEDLDILCHAELGKGTWWFPALMKLKALGFETKLISSLDYKRLTTEKFLYMKERADERIASWYEHHSNLPAVLSLLPEFLTSGIWQEKTATLKDIDTFLENGWLVGVELNARTFNDKEGLSPHMVILFHKADDNTYTLHDPGLPPIENRTVTQKELVHAWQFAGVKNTSLVAVRKINYS